MNEKITIEIASVPDRDALVAELWLGSEQLGEVRQETARFRLQLYPKQDGQPWDVDGEDFTRAINKAIHDLL